MLERRLRRLRPFDVRRRPHDAADIPIGRHADAGDPIAHRLDHFSAAVARVVEGSERERWAVTFPDAAHDARRVRARSTARSLDAGARASGCCR
ncbi:MAG: hypothetical protein JSR54_03600 [Proteobacteria bacterium]|nr:hypothetical protein [Pseudomonadota bacterium]